MVENDADAVFAGELLQPFDRPIVTRIGLFIPASQWSDLGEGIDPNQARLFGRLAPCLDILEAALVHPFPFGVQFKRLGAPPLCTILSIRFFSRRWLSSSARYSAPPCPGLVSPSTKRSPATAMHMSRARKLLP